MEWVLLLVAVLSLAIFIGLMRPVSSKAQVARSNPAKVLRVCPLCGQVLLPGQTVHSTMFKHGGDKLMEIVGCPYCRTDVANPNSPPLPRNCPVCHRVLDPDETVPARVFQREKGMHVHVLGCRVCRRVQR